ncbi:hypothetical protein ACFPJ1_11795 [Kribbella qitaiheensis]|uniref:hypothetical protein n=1 Tax=Kribbella qitaiheensis TaxID=1544730 RepID=UPI0036172AC6
MKVRRVSALVGFLLLIPSAVTVAVLAGPADAAPTALPTVEGKVLALDPDPEPHGYQFEAADHYVPLLTGPASPGRPKWQVRSTADGAVVSEFAAEPGVVPEIVGRSIVTRTVSGDSTRFAFTGLGGAPAAGAITVPATDRVLAVHEKGVLVSRPDGSGGVVPVVHVADGSARPVTGLPELSHGAVVFDGDGDLLLVRNDWQLYTVDVVSAAATLVVNSPDLLSWVAITPGRIFWTTSAPNRLAWKQRDGSPGGTVDLPSTDDLTTLGDGVAMLRYPASGSLLRRELRPLDLATGQAGDPVLDDIAAARTLSDGRLLVARTDAVLAVTPALARTTIAKVDAPVRTPSEVVISNGRVLSAYEDGSVRETTLTGTSWTSRTDIPATKGTGNGLQMGGDTVYRQRDLVVRWPGGQRALNPYGAADLGRGGALLSYMSFNDQSTYSIQNPRTGAVLATRPTARPIAMDGNWVWQAPDPQTGVITGADVVSGQTKNVPSSARCAAGSFSVAGRWALVSCGVHQQYAVDLLGIVPNYRLPDNAPAEQLYPAVGDGFVVRMRFTPDASGHDVPELLVTDLNSPAHTERVVGPIRGTVWPPGASFALDDKTARIVYIDPESRVRVATVDWLAAPPATQLDTTAPKLASATAGPRVSVANPVRFSYRFTDNVAVASYDVVYKAAAAGKVFGKWTYPTTWQAMRSTAVSVSPAAGTDVCFMVRARDARGNLSAWSLVTCAVTPQDDRAFSAAGSFARLSYTSAYRGTLTQLRRSGAVLYKDGETGNRIAVTALTAPRQGIVDVTFAGRRISRINLAATTVTRRTFYLPVPAMYTGRVTVTSVSALPSSIDAVALLRS